MSSSAWSPPSVRRQQEQAPWWLSGESSRIYYGRGAGSRTIGCELSLLFSPNQGGLGELTVAGRVLRLKRNWNASAKKRRTAGGGHTQLLLPGLQRQVHFDERTERSWPGGSKEPRERGRENTPRLPKPRTPWITCRRRGRRGIGGWRSSWRGGIRGPSSPGSPCPPSTRRGSAPLRRATWQPWTTKWKRALSASTNDWATASVLLTTPITRKLCVVGMCSVT